MLLLDVKHLSNQSRLLLQRSHVIAAIQGHQDAAQRMPRIGHQVHDYDSALGQPGHLAQDAQRQIVREVMQRIDEQGLVKALGGEIVQGSVGDDEGLAIAAGIATPGEGDKVRVQIQPHVLAVGDGGVVARAAAHVQQPLTGLQIEHLPQEAAHLCPIAIQQAPPGVEQGRVIQPGLHTRLLQEAHSFPYFLSISMT